MTLAEQQIERIQFEKTAKRRLQAEKDVPKVRKWLLALGVTKIVCNCNTCFHLKTQGCVGMDCLTSVCKYWFDPEHPEIPDICIIMNAATKIGGGKNGSKPLQ